MHSTDSIDASIQLASSELASARGAYNAALAAVRSAGDRSQALGAVSVQRSTVEALESELEALQAERDLAVARDSSAAEVDRRQRAVDAAAAVNALSVERCTQEAVLLDALSISWVRAVHSYGQKSRLIAAQLGEFLNAAFPDGDDRIAQATSFVDHGAGSGLATALQTMLRAAFRGLPDQGDSIAELTANPWIPDGYQTIADGAAAPGAVRLAATLDNALRALGLDAITPTPPTPPTPTADTTTTPAAA